MSLLIAEDCANFQITITNAAGGLSSRSSIAIALKLTGQMVGGDFARLANIMRDGLKPIWDNQWSVGPIHVNENIGLTILTADDNIVEAGTDAAGTYLTPAIAYVVSKQTNIAGRRFRGRFFLPGVPDAVDEAGVIPGAVVTSIQGILDTLWTNLNADASVEYVALLHDESTPNSHIPTEINRFLLRDIVGTMRPRQRR